jgi:hypothetical protein
MRPYVQHNHAGPEKAFDKTALSQSKTAGKHRSSASIVSGQPPSDFGDMQRLWNLRNVPQPAEKH